MIAATALALVAGPAGTAAAREAAAADLILTNARVYTLEAETPWAEAVAVDDGRIVAVGSARDVAVWAGPSTRLVDLGGRLLMPAFGDAHVHPVFGGMSFSRCSLHDGRSIEDYQRIIAGCITDAPGDGAVYGVGWGDALFPPHGVPRKELLDAVSRTRPLIFESVGGHSYWVNSRALALAGITKDTPDPANGHIDRDPETGEPVGGLQEAAMNLVSALVPKPTAADIQNSIRYTARHFNALGITMWHDAGIDLAADGTSETLAAYKAVQDQGGIPIHVAIAFRWANDRGMEQVPAIMDAVEQAKRWGLKADAVKFYADGVIPQRTAAMIEPYAGSEDVRGKLQIEPETLTAAVVSLGKAGIQTHVHAIGDRAVRVALDAVEADAVKNGASHRAMISHLNVIDPADQPRFGKLGVIAQFQPSWASNYAYMDLTKQALGPTRSQHIYPARAIIRGGGMIAYGADWPVGTANPLLGIQVAVTRTNYEDASAGPLLSEQGLTVAEAVRAHTINVAYALGLERTTGSIAVGKSADLVIVDCNILEIPADQIGKARILMTLFSGRPVHGDWDSLMEKSVADGPAAK